MNESTCSTCGADVLWVTGNKGARIILDREPRENGNIVIVDGQAVYLKKGEETSQERYQSHFSSCPDARDWRR